MDYMMIRSTLDAMMAFKQEYDPHVSSQLRGHYIAAIAELDRADPTDFDKAKVRTALDELGKALADHNHHWSPELRKGYESGIRAMKKTEGDDNG